MVLIGTILTYLGLLLTVTGLVVGFACLYFFPESFLVNTLGFVPIGFITLFAGTMTRLLFGKNRSPEE